VPAIEAALGLPRPRPTPWSRRSMTSSQGR